MRRGDNNDGVVEVCMLEWLLLLILLVLLRVFAFGAAVVDISNRGPGEDDMLCYDCGPRRWESFIAEALPVCFLHVELSFRAEADNSEGVEGGQENRDVSPSREKERPRKKTHQERPK